jgi:o-succinylbenzoate synthase
MLSFSASIAMSASHAVNFHLEYRVYRRKFLRPLVTAHGRWRWREGVIVRLTDADGRTGYGESAPTPGFTQEAVEEDLGWLRKCGGGLASRAIAQTPPRLACLRWALSCARAMLEHRLPAPKKIRPLPLAALLPAGREALEALPQRVAEGYRVFKWKVGIKSPAIEIALLKKLLLCLPANGQLRLDANGALTMRDWKFWGEELKTLGAAIRAIEFFEQPGMFHLNAANWAKAAPVSVALDESVTGSSARRNHHLKKWPGPLVVKPSLWGDVNDFIRWRANRDIVYSSVFETSIGLDALLNLAATDAGTGRRALGLGTLTAFADDGLQLPVHAPGPTLAPSGLCAEDFLKLWDRLDQAT